MATIAINGLGRITWYDNEWGFTNQMVREAQQLGQVTEVVS